MRKHTVIEKPLVLAGGVLELTDEQAGPRMLWLKPLKEKGHYEVTAPVCFKVGEVIGCASVDKGMRRFLEPVDHQRPEVGDLADDVAHAEKLADKIGEAVEKKTAGKKKK